MITNFLNRFKYSPSGDGGMKYYSLNKISPLVSFEEATISGQAPDKGLYFPSFIPKLSKDFIADIKSFSKEEIGFEVMKPFVGESIPDGVLQNIITANHQF